MTNPHQIKTINPELFEEVAGAEGALLIVVSNNNEQEMVVPEGTHYQDALFAPDFGLVGDIQLSACYPVCWKGRIWICCGNRCVQTPHSC